MNAVEAQSRRGRNGVTADRLANTARLGVLEKHLGIKIKRYKDPGTATGDMRSGQGFIDSEKSKEEESGQIIMRGF